jgi:hypothetical protein
MENNKDDEVHGREHDSKVRGTDGLPYREVCECVGEECYCGLERDVGGPIDSK